MITNKRKSNFELCRIFAILLIITFHAAFEGGFYFENLTTQKLIIYTFHMFGEVGVNLFILISGYFMIHTNFRFKKLIQLLLEVWFYNWICYALAINFKQAELNPKTFFANIFPITEYKYWFATAYLLIYLFSPYINKLLKNLSKKEYQSLLCLSIIIYSVIPTFYGMLNNDTERLFYYNRFIWLIIIYCFGAYLHLYPPKTDSTCIKYLFISIGLLIFLISSIVIFERFSNFFRLIGITDSNYFWRPNTLPIFCLSISCFLFFYYLEIPYCKLINQIASTTFGIYLLSDGQMNFYLWREIFQVGRFADSSYIVLHIGLCVFLVFITCCVFDFIRQAIARFIMQLFHI